MSEVEVKNHNGWYIVVPGILFALFCVCEPARNVIGIIILTSILSFFLIVLPLTAVRIAWKVFKWAWS